MKLFSYNQRLVNIILSILITSSVCEVTKNVLLHQLIWRFLYGWAVSEQPFVSTDQSEDAHAGADVPHLDGLVSGAADQERATALTLLDLKNNIY